MARRVDAVITATHWSGPLPPPETLEAFKRASPTAVDEIIAMAKNEQQERFAQDRDVLSINRDNMTHEHADIRRGQYVAAGLISFVAVLATVCAYFHEWQVGCALAGFGAVGIAYAFIGRKG